MVRLKNRINRAIALIMVESFLQCCYGKANEGRIFSDLQRSKAGNSDALAEDTADT